MEEETTRPPFSFYAIVAMVVFASISVNYLTGGLFYQTVFLLRHMFIMPYVVLTIIFTSTTTLFVLVEYRRVKFFVKLILIM